MKCVLISPIVPILFVISDIITFTFLEAYVPSYTSFGRAVMRCDPNVPLYAKSGDQKKKRKTRIVDTDTDTKKIIDIPSNVNTLNGKNIYHDFTPVNDMILLQKVDIMDVTAGGIHLPGSSAIIQNEGRVISAGPGRTNSETGILIPMPVHPGDNIIYDMYHEGDEFMYNDQQHVLIHIDDILLVYPANQKKTSNNIKVLEDRVLVRVDDLLKDQKEGQMLLNKWKEKVCTGEVRKVGPGRLAFNGVLMDMEVEVGDWVKYQNFAGRVVEIDLKECDEKKKGNYMILRMGDLLLKF